MIYDRCQIFTPPKYVKELLNAVNYKCDIYGKSILDNSCGDGAVLTEAAERYIKDALQKNIKKSSIIKGLEKDIVGFEVDPGHKENCIKNLNNISRKYDIYNVKWKIMLQDFLRYDFKNKKFDYIVGNPPYISYRDIKEEKEKEFLSKNFKSCSAGKFDYSFAFIEKSIQLMSCKTGKMSYLIPNSIFKNVSAKEIRNQMLPVLTRIIDLAGKKVFNNALVSTAIIVFDNSAKQNFYLYKKGSINKKLSKLSVEDKFIFDKIKENKNKERFGDFFNVGSSVATLLNKAFVIKNFHEKNNYIIVNGSKLKKDLLKKAYTPRNIDRKNNEYIIFPYILEKNSERITEEDLKNNYSDVYNYLFKFKNDLDKRNVHMHNKWYEYGRSQAIKDMNKEKLLVSSIVTHEFKVLEIGKEGIPYSGLYITKKDNNKYNLQDAKEILKSNSFFKYLKKMGTSINGKSIRISNKDILNYRF